MREKGEGQPEKAQAGRGSVPQNPGRTHREGWKVSSSPGPEQLTRMDSGKAIIQMPLDLRWTRISLYPSSAENMIR